jgi:thermitase
MKPTTLKRLWIHWLIPVAFMLMGAEASALDIQLLDGKLSVTADKVPLQQLLQHLAQYGITARVDPDINPAITASFENKELEDGLRSLLKSLNYIFIWRAEGASSSGQTGPRHRLAEIQVFNPGEKGRMVALEPPGRWSSQAVGENDKEESEDEPETDDSE